MLSLRDEALHQLWSTYVRGYPRQFHCSAHKRCTLDDDASSQAHGPFFVLQRLYIQIVTLPEKAPWPAVARDESQEAYTDKVRSHPCDV
jgi:hypothetical protein